MGFQPQHNLVQGGRARNETLSDLESTYSKNNNILAIWGKGRSSNGEVHVA